MRHRRGTPCPSYDVRVDRGTIFGNPFDFQKLGITRDECVEKYRDYFYKRIATDANFRNQILTLKDKVLGCWCVPLDCHATIIAEYLNSYASLQTQTSL